MTVNRGWDLGFVILNIMWIIGSECWELLGPRLVVLILNVVLCFAYLCRVGARLWSHSTTFVGSGEWTSPLHVQYGVQMAVSECTVQRLFRCPSVFRVGLQYYFDQGSSSVAVNWIRRGQSDRGSWKACDSGSELYNTVYVHSSIQQSAVYIRW